MKNIKEIEGKEEKKNQTTEKMFKTKAEIDKHVRLSLSKLRDNEVSKRVFFLVSIKFHIEKIEFPGKLRQNKMNDRMIYLFVGIV